MVLFRGADEDDRLHRMLTHLATAQRVAQLGSWERDLVSGDLEWSPAVHDIFGWPPERAPTFDAFVEAVHPDDRAAFLQAREEALAGRRHFGLDHRIVRPDGTVRHVHEEAEVVRDAEGRPVRLIGIVQDRTERVRTEARLARAEAVRRSLLHELLRTTDHERARLATALHDDPIQQLAVAAMRLEHAATTSEEPLGVDDLVADIHDVIRHLREELFRLEPLTTRIVGVGLTLEHLARTTLADVERSVVDQRGDEPPEAVSNAVVRIAQEALANVREHAGAHRVEIRLTGDATHTTLQVRDDGRGFDVTGHRPQAERLGLLSMEERATALGGTLEVRSDPGGTTVVASIPHP